jgi:PAS domain S-box-containing protein
MSLAQNMAIKHKLMAIIMVTCTASLLLSGVIQFLFERGQYREETIDSMSCYAEMIGDNCKAALAFGDADDAKQTLESLRAESSIVFACIYTKERKVLAHYKRPGVVDDISPPAYEKEGHRFDGDYFKLFKQVKDDNDVIGTVYIQLDLSEARARLGMKAGVIALVLVVCSLLAYTVSLRLQAVISGPILSLANVAKAVSEKKDYSTRASKQSNDEVGLLIDAFNAMLEQIQQSDSDLREARDKLEIRVRTRTAELTDANQQLMIEMDERAKVEQQVRQQNEYLNTVLESLDASHRIMEGIINAIPVRVFWKDKNLAYLGCNAIFARDAGFTDPKDIVGKDDYQMGWRDQAELYRSNDRQVMESGRPKLLAEEPQTTPEGNSITLLTSKVPLHDSKGEIIGVIGTYMDITERKRAEAELKAAQEKIIESAHKAGMAEVAADVLHNVGNVLNSINVAAGFIQDKLSNSKVASLKKVVDTLCQHTGDLEAFLTRDERGKHVPLYLEEAAKLLVRENADMAEKLLSLTRNVEHIKQIIKAQQRYARAGGVEGFVNINDIVSDAVEINTGGLTRHRVDLKLDLAELPAICLDKQRVLQILVNLISNAKYALSEIQEHDRRMTIRSYTHGPDKVRIDVEDNGAGIPRENMAKIFRHGFTTREGGDGFGLHSSALAAKEMGGDLVAHSDGPRCGAVFTLELPLKMKQMEHHSNDSGPQQETGEKRFDGNRQ